MNKKTIITLAITLLSTTTMQSMHSKKIKKIPSNTSLAKRSKQNKELFSDKFLELLWKQTDKQVALQQLGFNSLTPESRNLLGPKIFECQQCLSMLEKYGKEEQLKKNKLRRE